MSENPFGKSPLTLGKKLIHASDKESPWEAVNVYRSEDGDLYYLIPEKLYQSVKLGLWKQGMTDAGEICDALVDKPDSVKYQFGPAIRKARDAKAIQNNPAS